MPRAALCVHATPLGFLVAAPPQSENWSALLNTRWRLVLLQPARQATRSLKRGRTLARALPRGRRRWAQGVPPRRSGRFLWSALAHRYPNPQEALDPPCPGIFELRASASRNHMRLKPRFAPFLQSVVPPLSIVGAFLSQPCHTSLAAFWLAGSEAGSGTTRPLVPLLRSDPVPSVTHRGGALAAHTTSAAALVACLCTFFHLTKMFFGQVLCYCLASWKARVLPLARHPPYYCTSVTKALLH